MKSRAPFLFFTFFKNVTLEYGVLRSYLVFLLVFLAIKFYLHLSVAITWKWCWDFSAEIFFRVKCFVSFDILLFSDLSFETVVQTLLKNEIGML